MAKGVVSVGGDCSTRKKQEEEKKTGLQFRLQEISTQGMERMEPVCADQEREEKS